MTLRVDNRAKITAVAIGTYHLWLLSDFYLELRDFYWVIFASRNLIFISSLAQDDYEISFNKDHCTIYFKNKMIGHSHLINNLYQLHIDADESVNLFEQIVSVVGSKRFRDEINLKYM